jgi:hypothetical protein
MADTRHLTGMSPDDLHRYFNYHLHEGVDLLKLGIVLEQMVEMGKMDPAVAETFEHMAAALLGALVNENNRAFGSPPRPPLR